MTDLEQRFLQVLVMVMLLACAFSRTWVQLLIRFIFFSLLVAFLMAIFHA